MMLYLVFTRHLTCYTWCMIYDTDTWYVILDTCSTALDIRHRYLICHTCHLILTPGIWHMLTFTWYAFMWYKYIDLISWLLTGHYHPWYLYYMAPDVVAPVSYCIFMTITLLGLDYYIVTRYLVLLNSCTPEPLKEGDSWYYTPVNSRSWMIMVILYALVDIIFGQYI